MNSNVASVDLVLRRIDQKKQTLDQWGGVPAWTESFSYPSTDGSMQTIDGDIIKKMIATTRLYSICDLTFEHIKTINRSLDRTFDGESRTENAKIDKGKHVTPIRTPNNVLICPSRYFKFYRFIIHSH
jgi:hypothetical protein